MKPDNTPNVNFPEIRASKDLSLEEVIHPRMFCTWDWTRDGEKEDIQEKLW